ncbi:hypothetical protein COCNU_06G001090 [Cocos nucifera]|uniref:Uncharacterized protein n=1 Tax=Cocos nucifera TaxID=13894 RepID=A0A8K0IAE4_COCNU|nr:hypothetical protein COCNU_06G001090 [Cocos nucifera]
MENAREARRRKIMERGSERLAFITGQSRSLTPSSSFSTSPTLQQQQGEEEDPRSTTAGTSSVLLSPIIYIFPALVSPFYFLNYRHIRSCLDSNYLSNLLKLLLKPTSNHIYIYREREVKEQFF